MNKRLCKSIALIGMMGTGKSFIGTALAEYLGLQFIDVDSFIMEQESRTIPEIFAQDGEEAFRAMEFQAISALLESGSAPKVLATGGGCVTHPETLALLKEESILVALTADVETIYERIKGCTNRPLLQTEDPKRALQTLMEQRAPLYAQAHVTIQSLENDPEETLSNMIKALQPYL